MKSRLWVAVATLALCACSEEDFEKFRAEVRGRISDAEGSQRQGFQVPGGGLGGSGTVAAASKVRASTVGQGGSLEVVGEADVSAQGSYTLDVPADQQRLVIQAVDASGTVVASALLEASGTAESSVVAPPMDSESSLEAQLFIQMVADGTQAAQIDVVDLRSRVTADMAVAAQQGASTATALGTRVKVLAEAVRAAQETELRAYGKAGVQTSQGALFEAELAAAAKLNAALDAGTSAEAAYQAFHAEVAAAAERLGADAKEQAQAESSAGVAFRATVKARLSAQDAQPLADASLRAAAAAEARTSAAAITAILQAAQASDAVLQQAGSAATALRTQMKAAATAGAAAQAFTSFSASVATGADVKTTVLGSYVGVNLTNQAAVSLAVQTTKTAAATLDTALDVAVDTALASNQTNVTLLATGIADAYAAYASTVQAQATALATIGTKATPAVDLLVVSEGAFRLR
jgi:hypothetical protein